MNIRKFFEYLWSILEMKPLATHISDGKNHLVALEELRVVVFEEEPGVWAAQCIDLDYAASGDSLDDVKRRFEIGLTATISAHVKTYGSLAKFIRNPPFEEWVPVIGRGEKLSYSSISNIDIQSIEQPNDLPFEKLTYMEPMETA